MKYECVNEMSDEDYNKVLVLVNDHFRKHPVLIKENSLEPYRGPQSAEERESDKADYLGKPKRFKFYSKVVFHNELTNIRPGLTLEEGRRIGKRCNGMFAANQSYLDELEHDT